MAQPEPNATAIALVTFGTLLATSVLFSRATTRISVPVTMIFLGLGMLAGSEGIGGIDYADYAGAYRLGTIALVLILFDGGLNTSRDAVRGVLGPAGVLATIGVLGVAALTALGARLLGFAWPVALLVGAIVSSTDAAMVFSVLRNSGLQLKRRIGATLEVESGINDPMAVILTTILSENLAAPGALELWKMPLQIAVQAVVGGAVGWAVAIGGRRLLRLPLPAGGLYPALTLALATLAYGAATMLGGSGFLATYLAGYLLGNGPLPYRAGIVRVHDSVAWLSQIGMFLLLGLLVFPSRLPAVALTGLGLALILAFVARPLVVLLCLLPFRYPAAEIVYAAWVGLRGAVPIVLATFPVMLKTPGAEQLFDIVFFIVVVSALIPGTTVPWVTRLLGMQSDEPPPPAATLAIETRQPMAGDLLNFHVDETMAVVGASIGELPLPTGAAVTLLVRGPEILPPSDGTVLRPGDAVYLFVRPEAEGVVRLLFGRPLEE